MKLLIILSVLVTTAYSYNILCVFPLPTLSHNQLGWGIVNALLKAGHEVTWATPYPKLVKKDVPKSLKVIDVSVTKLYTKDGDMTNPENFFHQLSLGKWFAYNVTHDVITTPALRQAIVTTQYDAVFTQAFYYDIFAGLAAVQQVPWLLLSAPPINPFLEGLVDDVRAIPVVPILYDDYLDLSERVLSSLSYFIISVTEWLDRKNTDDFYKQLFEPLAMARGVPLPTFDEALNNVSILFMNSHESVTPALTTPPNVINIAGFHMDEEAPPLPKDLQDLLDASRHGVIYFNIGHRASKFPENVRDALLRALARLQETVLWKLEATVVSLPPNVYLRRWMPQRSILAHPNVRVFITHGGVLSSLEAVKAGVPTLVVPVFAEQSLNAERAVIAGYARRVDLTGDVTDELVGNLWELLQNNTYQKRAKAASKLFRLRPVSPAELIAHYTELAIETKGAYHLRSISNEYAWYQRWMVDQVAFVLIILVLLLRKVLSKVKKCAGLFKFKKNVEQKPTEQKTPVQNTRYRKKRKNY